MYHGQSSKTEIDKRREAKAAAELQKVAQDNKVRDGTLVLLNRWTRCVACMCVVCGAVGVKCMFQ